MHFSRKRWRLALIAVLTALAVSVAFTGEAFAQEGEAGSWNEEYVGSDQLALRGTISEARNGGELLQAWRGATNNIVWLSRDNESAFELRNPDGSSTATYVSPTVVPYGQNSFMVFHTGTNGVIYYTQVNPANSTWSLQWYPVPNQASNMTVSVAQLGPGSNQLYMVYRGVNSDQVWGTLYDGYGWQGAQNIGGGRSPSAPSVTYNYRTGGLFAAVRGNDNQVWMSASGNRGSGWSEWWANGGYTYVSPAIVANGETGLMLLGEVDENTYRPNYRVYASNGSAISDWSQDITGWQTVEAVQLVAVGAAMYVLMTGLNGWSYYKQAFYGS